MTRPAAENIKNNFLRTAGACAALAALASHAAPTVAPTPFIPTYGQAVSLQLKDAAWPTYIPATRYSRNGNHFTVDYEIVPNNFDSARSDFGYKPVGLGELPAGNYTVTARIFDMTNPSATPTEVKSQFAVAPPAEWGAYAVPQNPEAYEPTSVMIRSAAYFDAATLRSSVSGNVIRVDFDYAPEAPASGVTPAGLTTFASVKVGNLAPGSYRIEAWGRPRDGGVAQKYFTRDFTVENTVTVHEYYAASIDHYFVAAGPDEVAILDGGTNLGWSRTGHKFRAWLKASDAPASAKPVCRFYAAGPNSHFYTGDASECQMLRNLEAKDRAEAQAASTRFWGWGYEGVAFYALMPVNGVCPGDTDPVYRSYNNRAGQNDTNHRFTVDGLMRAAMRWTWIDEGVAFCSPR
jgi:hypothetical protein